MVLEVCISNEQTHDASAAGPDINLWIKFQQSITVYFFLSFLSFLFLIHFSVLFNPWKK